MMNLMAVVVGDLVGPEDRIVEMSEVEVKDNSNISLVACLCVRFIC